MVGMSPQAIAGPHVSIGGFGTLLKGTAEVLWRWSDASPY